MTQDLSEHRHISFTAHYTGYIWYSMGISHPVFATGKGKFLAKILHPLESWAEKHVGGSMRTTLRQRHRIIDNQLTQLIQQQPDLQILEIACGLSPMPAVVGSVTTPRIARTTNSALTTSLAAMVCNPWMPWSRSWLCISSRTLFLMARTNHIAQ